MTPNFATQNDSTAMSAMPPKMLGAVKIWCALLLVR